MKKEKSLFGNILLVIFLVIFFLVISLSTLYTDFLWFKSLDFQSIFLTILSSKLLLFFAGFMIFFILALINFLIVKKVDGIKIKTPLAIMLISFVSVFVGFISSEAWFNALKFFNHSVFNINDPIFAKDVGFYIFTLPFLNQVWMFVFSSVLLITIFVAVLYMQQYLKEKMLNQAAQSPEEIMKPVNEKFKIPKMSKKAKNHLFVLFSFIFLLASVKYYLAQYSVMYSKEGIVVGAGFTDIHVFLPVIKILMVLAIVIAVSFYFYMFFIAKKPKLRKRHILFFIFAFYLVVAFVGQSLAPALVQSLMVDPNELNLEKPYIDNNIEFTRLAYGLNEIEEKEMDIVSNLTRQDIEDSSDTISNIRILDYRPLTQTYKQTQEIRLYYDLSGIDIDRYMINGSYTQVMLAPRELNQQQIVDKAKTWVNLHMVYSHGFGIVMSPVNKVTTEGLPDYLIKDIPPLYTVDEKNIKINQPRIYYGNRDNNYVLVNTNTDEFDYPQGNKNKYNNYDGRGGIILDNIFDKVMMALRFGDIKLLLSSDIKDESKIMFHRNIQKRISKIMPFLMLDRDPYITIVDGKAYWIQDAYTITGNYPYSEKLSESMNYIRNSVKVIVDAYNGDVNFYVVDKEDPLIQTYSKIFPEAFKEMEEMPKGFKEHLRYPEDLFHIQLEILNTYHMQDTNVFYNKEDAWELPKEIYGSGNQRTMEPYYMVMSLPENNEPEFIIMMPLTPLRKDNMISWLAGRSDKENYGKLVLYKFPKDKLIYGPSQIEARIDQDSEISQQLTLWSQQGSRVTRGNLLVIPIKNSILYVEPLYIQAERGQLPELKRVIASDGERVVMEETLGDALDELFGKVLSQTSDSADNQDDYSDIDLDPELISNANNYYQDMIAAMSDGDWESFGNNFDKLGETLSQLEQKQFE